MAVLRRSGLLIERQSAAKNGGFAVRIQEDSDTDG
jgi:hypothetical protein